MARRDRTIGDMIKSFGGKTYIRISKPARRTRNGSFVDLWTQENGTWIWQGALSADSMSAILSYGNFPDAHGKTVETRMECDVELNSELIERWADANNG